MTFTHPAALVSAVIVVWLWHASRRSSGVQRRRLQWRLLTLMVLVLAGSGLQIAAGTTPMTVMMAMDRSASVPAVAQQRALASIGRLAATMTSRDRLGVVSFGTDATLDLRPAAAASLRPVTSTPGADGTDIAAAIRVARAALPPAGPRRILLVTDGRETSGDGEREALYARAAGVSVDVLLPDTAGVVEPPHVSSVTAPGDVAANEPYDVTVAVSGSPATRATVTLYRGDAEMMTSPVTLGADGTATLVATDRQDQPGSYVYRASVASESQPEDNGAAAGAVVTVTGPSRLLYVSSSAPVLADLLAASGFAVTRVRAADLLLGLSAGDRNHAGGTLIAPLSGYAAVVLDDVAAEQLPSSAATALRDYVEQGGGGLLMLGSARTLTLDGYPAGPLADVMPIDVRPRVGSRAPSMALVVVFDKSGSMADVSGGIPKIEIAREAVSRVAAVMPSGDALGVVAFDSRPVAVAPLAPADPARLATQLQAIVPGGATEIAPALTLAYDWLRSRSVARRQILLLSDGRTSEQDAARVREQVRGGGAAVSVVAIGPAANRGLLESIAASTGGRAYFPDNVSDLPQVMAREAARAAGGGVVEERFVPQPRPHAVLDGINTPLPLLNGYVVSAARPTATVVIASHLGDPILAGWSSGVGRVAVFTADAGSAWSVGLRRWEQAPRLWAQTVRWISRPAAQDLLRVSLVDGRDGPRINVEARDVAGSVPDLDAVRATVRTGGGDEREVALTAIEPGRYVAPLAPPLAGAYAIAVTARDRVTGAEYRALRTIYWSATREYRHTGPDLPFLTHLASITGGNVLTARDSPFAAPRPWGYVDATAWLLTLGLAMFVGELVFGGMPRWRLQAPSVARREAARAS